MTKTKIKRGITPGGRPYKIVKTGHHTTTTIHTGTNHRYVRRSYHHHSQRGFIWYNSNQWGVSTSLPNKDTINGMSYNWQFQRRDKGPTTSNSKHPDFNYADWVYRLAGLPIPQPVWVRNGDTIVIDLTGTTQPEAEAYHEACLLYDPEYAQLFQEPYWKQDRDRGMRGIIISLLIIIMILLVAILIFHHHQS